MVPGKLTQGLNLKTTKVFVNKNYLLREAHSSLGHTGFPQIKKEKKNFKK